MDFSYLDDPEPPRPTAQTRLNVSSAGKQRVRSRRLSAVALTTACALSVGFAVNSARRDRPVRIAVAGNSRTRSSTLRTDVTVVSRPMPSTTALDPRIWVTVEVLLDETVVQRGKSISGTVIFNNRTGHVVKFADRNGCLSKWAVVVNGSRPTSFISTDECASQPNGKSMYTYFAPGVTRRAFGASTTVSECVPNARDQLPSPAGQRLELCLPNGGLPPLPAGATNLWFLGPTEHMQMP